MVEVENAVPGKASGTTPALWWVDLGWLPDTYPATLSLPLLNRTEEEEKRKKSSWVEIKTGRSLTSYCHGQNRLDSQKSNLIYCQLK